MTVISLDKTNNFLLKTYGIDAIRIRQLPFISQPRRARARGWTQGFLPLEASIVRGATAFSYWKSEKKSKEFMSRICMSLWQNATVATAGRCRQFHRASALIRTLLKASKWQLDFPGCQFWMSLTKMSLDTEGSWVNPIDLRWAHEVHLWEVQCACSLCKMEEPFHMEQDRSIASEELSWKAHSEKSLLAKRTLLLVEFPRFI